MDDHFDIGRVFEIGKFDITRLTCKYVPVTKSRELAQFLIALQWLLELMNLVEFSCSQRNHTVFIKFIDNFIPKTATLQRIKTNV